jgi:hypothetical protein
MPANSAPLPPPTSIAPGEVVASRNRVGDLGGEIRHGLVEIGGLLGVLRHVRKRIHAEAMAKCRLAGRDTVQQVTPCLLRHATEEQRGRTHRSGTLASQAGADRGQREPSGRFLGEHADARQQPQYSIERWCMRSARRRELAVMSRALAHQIRDAELCRDMDGTGDIVTRRHPQQGQRRRQFLRCHGIAPFRASTIRSANAIRTAERTIPEGF